MSEKLDISIVIPAFNEAKRLPAFLERVITYCNNTPGKYEIIVVDDGSSDQTGEVAGSFKGQSTNLSVIRLPKNRGKGYAIKQGFFKSKGRICTFLDADGSTEPDEIQKNIHYILEDGYDIFAGSREVESEGQIIKGKLHRRLIGRIFNFLTKACLSQDIKDNLCGFKIFKKEVIRPLFSRAFIEEFGFDMEIIYLAQQMGYRVKEGGVSWHHVDGSKVNLFTDSVRVFLNILQIKIWHRAAIVSSTGEMSVDEYDYMYQLEDAHWWFLSHRNLAMRLTKSLNIANPNILDLGTGTGANLVSFSKLGQTHGIDISEQAVAYCRRRGLNNVTRSAVDQITFQDKSFDIITCLDVLEHLADPQETLREMKRVLKNQGKIIITVPALMMLWSQHDEALGHLRRYQKKTLLADLQEAGLRTERMGYFFFSSFLPLVVMRMFKNLFVSRKKLQSDMTSLPPKFINESLKLLFKLELKIAGKAGLPFGSTLYAVVSKNEMD
ncbi:MAG: glycosyltransferase [Candidatus Omnitrophica bacterium]|nr:glycosyltransferase [Candidatus Omnitrophota bacterium]